MFKKVVEPPPKDSEHEKCVMRGYWKIALKRGDQVVEVREGYNVITTVGKEALARYLYSATTSGSNTFRYVAIGTGSTSESASDTALGTELARATGTVSYSSGAIYSVVATFTSGTGTGAIAEYGLFNSISAGTMLCRDTESVVNKGANDVLEVTNQITFS